MAQYCMHVTKQNICFLTADEFAFLFPAEDERVILQIIRCHTILDEFPGSSKFPSRKEKTFSTQTEQS